MPATFNNSQVVRSISTDATQLRCLLWTGLALLVAFMVTPAVAEQRLQLSQAEQDAIGISVARAGEPQTVSLIRAMAEVVPPGRGSASLTTPFDAVIVSAEVLPGSSVAGGDLVMELESPSFAAHRAQLESQRLMMEHRQELAEVADELFDLGVRSGLERDEAIHDAQEARLRFEELAAAVAHVTPGNEPSRFHLKAPHVATVSYVPFGTGDVVAAGTPVVRFFSGQSFWARAQLSDTASQGLRLGDPVSVATLPGTGKIVGIDPEIDRVTRSVEVLVSLPQADGIRLGQYVDVAFSLDLPPGALAVPGQALISIDGQAHVFVRSNTDFSARSVTIIRRSADVAVVVGEVRAGEEIVVTGLAALKNIAGGA